MTLPHLLRPIGHESVNLVLNLITTVGRDGLIILKIAHTYYVSRRITERVINTATFIQIVRRKQLKELIQ